MQNMSFHLQRWENIGTQLFEIQSIFHRIHSKKKQFYTFYSIITRMDKWDTWLILLWTAVVRPHLVRSPRFIPESLFYTQSVMLSPRFIPKSAFYAQSVARNQCFILTV